MNRHPAAAAACAAIALLVYLLTLAPGVTFVDSGELAAVCATLGIAHPTGYPLYTLLGWVMLQLPLPVRPILVLNLFSALCSCLALFAFCLFMAAVFAGDSQGRAVRCPLLSVGLVCGTLLLAFSRVFWSVALVTEVYALHALILAVILLFSAGADMQRGFARTLGLFCALGLGLSNHLSTVLIVPGLVYLLAARGKLRALTPKKVLLLLTGLILGICVYAYVPLRAAQAPRLNWGDPSSWQNFFRHVSGWQYRVWMFESADIALTQLLYLPGMVLRAFGYLPVALIPFGIWFLFHTRRCMCWFSVIVFVSDVFYCINYNIKDIDTYYLPAFMMCSLWMSATLIYAADLVCSKKKSWTKPVAGLLCIFPIITIISSYNAVDQSGNTLVERYTHAVLDNLEDEAVVLSYQWDYFCSPFYYFQLVEGLRPDVALIETELLKRSWYLKQLRHTYPRLMARSQDEVARYARELDKFEQGRPYDPRTIQAAYAGMVNSFIQKNMAARPVYVTCEAEEEIGRQFRRVPEGLVFRLYNQPETYRPFHLSRMDIPRSSEFAAGNPYHTALKSFYAFMLTARAAYELRFKRRQSAEAALLRAKSVFPDYPLVEKGLAALHEK